MIGFSTLFLGTAWVLFAFGQNDLLLFVLCLSVCLPVGYLLLDRLAQRNELLRMRQEALRSELSLLKHQINPHFFFNTLNSLYALTLSGSERAPQMILALSDLMRFTIYEGKRDHVPLKDEVTYLMNYVNLYQLRFDASLNVNFHVEIEHEDQSIAPLLLIMLLENAFKHGVSEDRSDAWVRIDVQLKAKKLTAHIENSLQELAPKENHRGIGLANIRRQLELRYPSHSTLVAEIRPETENMPASFRVMLTVSL